MISLPLSMFLQGTGLSSVDYSMFVSLKIKPLSLHFFFLAESEECFKVQSCT